MTHQAPETASSHESEDIPATDPATIAFWRARAGELSRSSEFLYRNADRLAEGTVPRDLIAQHVQKLTTVTAKIAGYRRDRTDVDTQFRVLAGVALELLGHPDPARVLAECNFVEVQP